MAAHWKRAVAAAKATREPRELVLHKAVAAFLSSALRQPTWHSTFPAGGGGKIRGAVLKACGLRAGVPDIIIVDAGRALFIELKSAHGRLSYDQSACIAALGEAGSSVAICRSIEDVELALRAWRIPLHASVLGLRIVAA